MTASSINCYAPNSTPEEWTTVEVYCSKTKSNKPLKPPEKFTISVFIRSNLVWSEFTDAEMRFGLLTDWLEAKIPALGYSMAPCFSRSVEGFQIVGHSLARYNVCLEDVVLLEGVDQDRVAVFLESRGVALDSWDWGISVIEYRKRINTPGEGPGGWGYDTHD